MTPIGAIIKFLHCISVHVCNRYRLHFEKESQKELDLRKHKAKTHPLKTVAEVVFLTLFKTSNNVCQLGRDGN